MPSTDSPGKAISRPDPSDGDMGMAWTRSSNVSTLWGFLDISPEPVHGVDMFPFGPRAQFAESTKLGKTIKTNLNSIPWQQ